VNGLGSSFKYSEKTAAALKNHKFDLAPLRTQGFRYERLDQLTTKSCSAPDNRCTPPLAFGYKAEPCNFSSPRYRHEAA